MNEIITVIRILVYTGPEEWIKQEAVGSCIKGKKDFTLSDLQIKTIEQVSVIVNGGNRDALIKLWKGESPSVP